MKYSIWVIPPEPVFSQVQSVVQTLSLQYTGPLFEPHLTILGGVEAELPQVIQATKTIAASCNQLQLTLDAISFSTTYFQSVLVRVQATAQLLQLNLDLKKALVQENTLYMPHLSLLYGNHDMPTREKAASQIQLPPLSFAVTSFVIVPSTLDPSEWQHLATVPF